MNERDQQIWDMTYTATFGSLMAGALIVSASDGKETVSISPQALEEFAGFALKAADAAVKFARRGRNSTGETNCV